MNGVEARAIAAAALDAMRQLGASDAVIEAYAILIEDRMPLDRAAQLAVGAERAGQDPVAAARHIVSLREALR